MIRDIDDLTNEKFLGLNTNSDFFNLEKGQSPNMMNVQSKFDGGLKKRLGSATNNSVIPTSTGTISFNSGAGTLTNNLISFWKLDETDGDRFDTNSDNTLTDNNSVTNAAGIIGNAALFSEANSEYLQRLTNPGLETGDIDFSISGWFYLNTTGFRTIVSKADLDVDLTLMIHPSGADADTTFIDSSIPNPKVLTGSGDVQIDTAQSQFGGRSILFDGTGDYLQTPDSSDWQLGGGTGDFTIDLWVRFAAFNTDMAFLSQRDDGDNYWLFGHDNGANENVFTVFSGGTSIINIQNAWDPSADTWYHVSLTKTNDIYRMFIDGTQIGSDQSDTSTIPDFTSDLRIGIWGTSKLMNGWFDEIRVSNHSRWSANFTAPLAPHNNYSQELEYHLYVDSDNKLTFVISHTGTSRDLILTEDSLGAVSTATWYNYVAWHDTGNTVGLSLNLSVTTSASYTTGLRAGSAPFVLGSGSDGAGWFMDGRQDETGLWKKVLSASERTEIYNAGNGITINDSFSIGPWAAFDFGASALRWYMIAMGTGIYASSDLGANFLVIGTDRTSSYQSFERSKNILVATSDRYDNNIYWTGSGGENMVLLNNSAPNCRFSVNFQGFLILLNSESRKRGFFYEDENSQLTGAWEESFDIPSSQDDEITSGFILRKKLYVSTRYKLYRVTFVGGNPDWSFLEVKDWGFVPRTVKKIFIKNIGEVIVGMSWDRRIRLFDGSDDRIISDNIENDNNLCEFALEKISFAGSGLVVSNAEYDTNTQEYKLCVAIGENSSDTTHILNLNGRTLSFYPYDNQPFNTLTMTESDNRRFLLASDRTGRVHQLGSSNLDVSTAISDVYDSEFLYDQSPSQIKKVQKIDLYLSPTSSNELLYMDRSDWSSTFNTRHRINIQNDGSVLQVKKSIDVPVTSNVYQWRITSSSNTANPWELNRYDYFIRGKGIGRSKPN